MPATRPRSALDVLYSESPLVLSTSNTLIAGDRVFTGAQPDDFAAAGLLTTVDSVCLIGLAFGAAIRTITSFLPDVPITAVDIDGVTGSICQNLYQRYFPRLPFEFVHQDGLAYLRAGTERFDVICVDLYLPEGYPDLLFQQEFWLAVRDRLTARGVVLVNAGGLPTHLRPLDPPSPQHTLLSVLTQLWPSARYLVNKRNWTIILESEPADATATAARSLRAGQFTGPDKAIMSLLPSRLRHAPVTGPIPGAEPPSFTRRWIDAEIDRRWPNLVAALRATATPLGISNRQSRPADIVADPENGPKLLRALLTEGNPAADFLATAASSLAMMRQPAVGWFGQWIVDELDWLAETTPTWLVTIGLPQALAMSACPLSPEWPWTDRLVDSTVQYVETDRQ